MGRLLDWYCPCLSPQPLPLPKSLGMIGEACALADKHAANRKIFILVCPPDKSQLIMEKRGPAQLSRDTLDADSRTMAAIHMDEAIIPVS